MDNVNHPKHYTNGDVECIDAIASAVVGKRPLEAVLVANVIKYLWRYEAKNGLEDVRKAKWYLDRLEATLRRDHEYLAHGGTIPCDDSAAIGGCCRRGGDAGCRVRDELVAANRA